MPFGAEPLPGGGARFRLWAPGARAVALVLEPAAPLPMLPMPGGWFALDCPEAGVGSQLDSLSLPGLVACRYRVTVPSAFSLSGSSLPSE